MRKAFLTHIILLLMSFCSTAQKATFEFFTTAEGLAGNYTSAVTQDDQGFIWFLNESKLHRYDGRNFIVYPIPKELSQNKESLLGLASWQDSLLFVWSENFPFLFNPKTGHWQLIKLPKSNIPNDRSRIWVRPGHGDIVMNRKKKDFLEKLTQHPQHNPLGPVLRSTQPLLLNTYYWEGRTAYDYGLMCQDTVYHLSKSGQVKAVTLLDNICKECFYISFQFALDGNLVMLSNKQFYQLDKTINRFVPHPANRFLQSGSYSLLQFILEKNGSIWACGPDRTLIYYDIVKDTLYNFQDELKRLLPNQNDFMGLFQDKTGIVWINTRLGLLKVTPQTNPFEKYFDGLNHANAYYSFRGLTEDNQGMIYGVYYDGIIRFHPDRKKPPQTYTFYPLLTLFDLFPEEDKIWLTGWQLLDPKSGKVSNIPSPPREDELTDNGFFAKEKDGTLWWASHYLLYRLHRSKSGLYWTKELELPLKVFNKTDALHAGRKSGKLWLSFDGKLLQYNPRTKQQRWFDPKTWNLSLTRITVIEEDQSGKLWLGTDTGLVQVDPIKGTTKQYTVHDGLPNDFICGLLTEGDSCLWLSTNHGLSRFHIPSKKFINFFEGDGLTHNEFNRKSYFKSRNGRMYFGGMRGINAFFPKEVMQAYQNRNRGANMVLTSIEYTDERQDTVFRETKFANHPEIHFNHWNWSYTFEYALTDYANPEETLYSYKMEGYKDSWSPPSKYNFTRFNNLPSGHYIFRVKARDSRGQWSPHELVVNVVVHPPWWRTWWAYAIYTLLFLSLAYIVYLFLKKRLLLQNELQRKQEETSRLKELDQVKNRLYTNLTHEFRTPLTVILGMAEQIREQPKKYLEEGTRLIQSNGKHLLQLINQLLDLSKLENKSFRLNLQQSDIVPYLRYITESFRSYANSQNLSLRFFTNVESCVMDYDSEQIKQVLTNLLSNAFKFTPSGGDIMIRLTKKEGHLCIEIQDTGIGIDANELPYIFDRFYQVDSSPTRQKEGTGIGLAHAQELVKLMEGEIIVKSQLGTGSLFTVTIPITHHAPFSTPFNFELPQTLNTATPSLLSNVYFNPPQSSLPQLLLIEDNHDVVVYLKSCLEGLYQINVAYNGRIGIEKALETIPDIIISDVMMPEKDGYQVCDFLKKDERTSHIPIILLTAKAGTDAKITGLKRGADAYLIKPFDKQELLVQLNVLIEKQKRLIAHFSKLNLTEVVVEEPPLKLNRSSEVEDFALEDAFVTKVRNIVAENFADETFDLTQLCLKIGMSRSQLFRKMKALMDTSPSDFIRSYRLNQAKTLLESGNFSVSEVAWQTGYKNPSHFSTSFQEEFGFPPSEIKNT